MTLPHDSGWQRLSAEVSYRHLVAGPSSGRLAHLAPRRLGFGAKNGLLVALGLHEAVPRTVRDDALSALLSQSDSPGDSRARIKLVQEEAWRLHENGGFYRGVPEILAICAEDDEVVAWRAGPNGLSIADPNGVNLVGEDYRYAALSRLGVDLSSLRPSGLAVDPLVDEVSGLSQIDPGEATQQETRLDRGQISLVMSRGALPFGPLGRTVGVDEWWKMDSGWRHGMVGELVAVTADHRIALADVVIRGFGRS